MPSALVSPQAASAVYPGATVIVAGYGSRSAEGAVGPDDGTGLKTWGTAKVLEMGSHELRVGRSDHPTSPVEGSLADKCGGDSGGPTFLDFEGEPVLVGVSSRGYDSSPRCDSASIDLRVEIFVPWILEELDIEGGFEAAPATAPAPGCSVGGNVGGLSGGLPLASLILAAGVYVGRTCTRRRACLAF
jgi:hypothetical protein